MRWISCGTLTLAATALFAAAQEAHTIAWNPTKGAKSKHVIEMKSEVDFGQGPMPLHAKLTVDSEIKDIAGDKITMVSTISQHELLVAEQDVTSMMPGGDLLSTPVTRTYSKKGPLLTSDAKSDFDNPRFEQLRVVAFPENAVKVGDTWTNEFKGLKDKNVPPSRAKFTLDAIEEMAGKPVFRLKFAFSELEGEKPMGALGTVWLDKATGELMKMDTTLNDAQFTPEMPPMNFHLTITKN